MKKQVIALAVAAAVVAPAALAQASSVTVYGRVNVGIQFDKNYLNNGSTTRVENMGSSSRLGFQGTEDLGNGLKARFQVETSLKPDNPGTNFDGTAASATSLGNREAWVGLQGDFGTVRFGRSKNAYQNAKENFDIGDGQVFVSLHEADNEGFSTGVTAHNDNSSRFNNTIEYAYANDTFEFDVDYAFGENGDKSVANKPEQKNFSASLKANFGDFWAIGAVYQEKDRGAVSGAKREAFTLGGGWSSGPLAVAAAYAQTEGTTGAGVKSDRDFFLVNGTYDIGNITLLGGYQRASKANVGGADVADSKYNNYLVGAHYKLSKRTKLISEYGVLDVTGAGKKDASTLTFAVMHRF